MSFFKFLLSLHNLKIERALHAASFKGLPRIRPAAPDERSMQEQDDVAENVPFVLCLRSALWVAVRKTRKLEGVQGDRLQWLFVFSREDSLDIRLTQLNLPTLLTYH